MRIHILSDLHLEFGDYAAQAVDADVVVLAGDIRPGKRGLQWILETFPNRPVIYVAGNHEFYAKVMPDLLRELRGLARGTHVHLLDNDSIELDGVRFWGGTLWTDFELNGNPSASMSAAEDGISDYRKIFMDGNERCVRADELRRLHHAAVCGLQAELADVPAAKRVVVTHHAPSPLSLPAEMRGREFAPAYASGLDSLVIESRVCLWIHGHIHRPVNYRLGDTRVVCNPRGYVFQDVAGFDPTMVVEV